jgi:serine/threonine-protein kinase
MEEKAERPRTVNLAQKGFELLDEIEKGGMGTIYKALQVSMERIIALKILTPKLADNKEYIERFLREARSAGKLNHPNIVRAIDVGEADGVYYFAMEYVEGQSVAKILKDVRYLPEKRAVEIIHQVAKGLQYAHEHNIIHRDIKPDNILIDTSDNAKICDLGIARSMETDEMGLTRTGVSLGTPHYVSPEQAQGRTIDARSDIYSLGVTLFHMIAGKPPFAGNSTMEIVAKHVKLEAPLLSSIVPEVSPGLEAVVNKCLKKDPSERYGAMDLLVKDIDLLIKRKPPLALRDKKKKEAPHRHTHHRAREHTGERKQPATAMIITGVVLLLMAVLGIGIFSSKSKKPATGDKPVKQTRPAPEEVPGPDLTAQQEKRSAAMYEYAEKYEAEHPEDLTRIIEKYIKVREAGKGTKYSKLAQDRIIHTGSQLVKTLTEKADAFVSKGDYDSAVSVWKAVPKHIGTELIPSAGKAAALLKKDAESRINTGLRDARKFLNAKEFDKGLAALDGLNAVTYKAWQGRIDKLRTVIETERTKAEDLAKKQKLSAAKARYTAYCKEFVLKTMKGNIPDALKAAEKAEKDPLLKPPAPACIAFLNAAAAVKKVLQKEQEFLQGLKDGKDHSFQTKRGTVKGIVQNVTDKEISMTVTGMIDGSPIQYQTKILIADLSREDRAKLRGGYEPVKPADYIAEAVFAFKLNNIPEAEKALTKARRHPLVPLYRNGIEELRMGAVEAAAKRTWETIAGSVETNLTPKSAQALLARIASFEKDHGSTKYAQSIKDQIQKLKDRASLLTAVWKKIPAGAVNPVLQGRAVSSVKNNILSITVTQGKGNKATIPLIYHAKNFKIKFEYKGSVLELFLRRIQWRGCFLLLLSENAVVVRTFPFENSGNPQVITRVNRNGMLPAAEWHAVEISLKDKSFVLSVDGKVLSQTDTLPAVARGDNVMEIYGTKGGDIQFRNISYLHNDRQIGKGTFQGIILRTKTDWITFKTDGEDVERRYVPVANPQGGYDNTVLQILSNTRSLNRGILEWRLENNRPNIVNVTVVKPKAKQGTLVGIVREKGRVWVEVMPASRLPERMIPQWTGGPRAQGGRLDPAVIQQISMVSVGDKVSIQWKYSARKRIISIKKIP